jgi:hypothetical protein
MRKIEMALIAAIIILVTLGIPARGQEMLDTKRAAGIPSTQAPRPEMVRKVIQLKYADPPEVANLVGNWGAELRANREKKIIAVIGEKSAVAAVEEAIAKLDVPPPPVKDVELKAYFLMANQGKMEGGKIPADLADVVTQLKRILNYENFHLINTALLRVHDGTGANVSGTFMNSMALVMGQAAASGGPGGVNITSRRVDTSTDFDFRVTRVEIVSEGDAPLVRVRNLSLVFSGDAPTPEGSKRTTLGRIDTNIDVKAGQKVVVGKTAFYSADSALILVLTANIVD